MKNHKQQTIYQQFYNFNWFHEKLQKQLQAISNQILEQLQSIQASNQYVELSQQCLEEPMIGSLVLKDDQISQEEYCLAIAFNQSGTIMASGCENIIKVWDYNNGKIEVITTLDPDQMQILSLIFSKNSNNFISGSINSINMWCTKNDKSWQNINQICNASYCMILNYDETKLYTGENDSISVWDVDFQNQKLEFDQSLPAKKIYSISLNEEETFLATCCVDKSIHLWEIKCKTIELYQIIQTHQLGYNLCFIKHNQFIWLPAEQLNINCIYVYDLQNGEFQLQEDKIINLLQDDTCFDSFLFPIVINKERNIIAIRHKVTVYLIQVFQNGKYQIITHKNLKTDEIYGTMTYNGTALILWDNLSRKYQIFDIEIQ
ncbi:unnamed protein product [Paramecium primaurelia]|uniref:WD40-repeat-containing domain n=1 Tax=Paramecium primaurelia TaxID=5886 RepID=A0A8S1Q8L3_PARPR|nr:unnamed protein product [Paramecium primaurelia]